MFVVRHKAIRKTSKQKLNYIKETVIKTTKLYCFLLICLFQPGLTGVCGVLTYMLEVDPLEDPEYLQMMFSVPYNLLAHGAYFAVGISEVYLNVTDLFSNTYYYTGSFQRKPAGQMAEYKSGKGELAECLLCHSIVRILEGGVFSF